MSQTTFETTNRTILRITVLLYIRTHTRTSTIMNNVFKRLFKSSIQTRLGRWSITKNHDEAKRKIDLANYDHCGTCPTIPKVKSDNFDNSMDVSICALQSLHSYPNSKTSVRQTEYKNT